MLDNNGGNNPPMPPQTSDDNGAYFTSTDSSNIPRPAIAGRPANTIEGPQHAAVSTTDDLTDYLKKQYVFFKEYTWSNTMLPGTIIDSIPITPLRSNEIIEHVCAIFNTWNGGLDYQVKVAGTGFHAGEIGVARIPPNIDPSTLKTVKQITAFETKYIDPKRLMAETESLPDQRPFAYHYMRDDFTNPDNIGGWLVIFVVMQLNSSSTGTSQIDLRVNIRAGKDFRLFQVKPPGLLNQPITDNSKWENLFATTELHYHTIFPFPIETMELAASTTTSAAAVGLRNLNGQLFLDETYTDVTSINNTPALGMQFYATSTTQVIPVKSSNTQFNRQISISSSATNPCRLYVCSVNSNPIAAAANFTFNSPSTVTGASAGSYYTLFSDYGGDHTVTYPGVTPFAPIVGESLVLFYYKQNGSHVVSKVLTTTALAALFKTRNYKIAPNEAVICQLFSRTTQMPIAYIKIHYNGIITTNAQATLVQLDFSDLYLVFLAYTQSSIPLPSLTQPMLLSLQSLRTQALLARMERLHLGD